MLRPSRAFTGGFETRPYVRVNPRSFITDYVSKP